MFNLNTTKRAPSGSRRTFIKAAAAGLALAVATIGMVPTYAAEGGKVLVVLSNAATLDLKHGKTYPTGYYLGELAIPLKAIVDAGYTPVFANPEGVESHWDPVSADVLYFNNDKVQSQAAAGYLAGIAELKTPKTLTDILAQGTDDYVGIFIPGGHAPMQDLMQNVELGKILRAFHDNGRPTGVICHGPAALLSAVADPVAFRTALVAGDPYTAARMAGDWPYAGYRVTGFSTAEESAIEGEGNQLGGQVQFYLPAALAQAGAHVDSTSLWNPNVIVDRELVSGQQPFSAEAFATAFVAKLKEAGAN